VLAGPENPLTTLEYPAELLDDLSHQSATEANEQRVRIGHANISRKGAKAQRKSGIKNFAPLRLCVIILESCVGGT